MELKVAAAPTSSAERSARSGRAPSFLKSAALALGTLALSTWALGTLWLQAERTDSTAAKLANAE